MTDPHPQIVPVADKNGLVFEAYILRDDLGRRICIDRGLVDMFGGIEKVRDAISPHHMIVCEVLK